jgi:hypothetical protein
VTTVNDIDETAPDEVEEVAAQAAAGEAHDHPPSPLSFPMDEDENFDRQFVKDYTDKGHEYDPPYAMPIMKFIVALALFCVASGIGVMQLMLAEGDTFEVTHRAAIPSRLTTLRASNGATLTQTGADAQRNTQRVTIGQATQAVIGDVNQLLSFKQPPTPKPSEAK